LYDEIVIRNYCKKAENHSPPGITISTAFATEDRRLPKHALLQLKQGGRLKPVAKLMETLWRMGWGVFFNFVYTSE